MGNKKNTNNMERWNQCKSISKYLIKKIFPSQIGGPVLYNLIDELMVEMEAFNISKRILEERLPKVANPIKGTTRKEKNQYKKKNETETLNKMKNQRTKKESDNVIQKRLSNANKSHTKILADRERERSRALEAEQEKRRNYFYDRK